MRAGKPLSEAIIETLVAACRRFSVSEVNTPADFPLDAADQLRAAGIEVRADGAALISVAVERRLTSSREFVEASEQPKLRWQRSARACAEGTMPPSSSSEARRKWRWSAMVRCLMT